MGMEKMIQSCNVEDRCASEDNMLLKEEKMSEISAKETDNTSGELEVAIEDSPPSVQQDGDVTVALEQSDLWQTFARRRNEMIVTRSGRWVESSVLIQEIFHSARDSVDGVVSFIHSIPAQ